MRLFGTRHQIIATSIALVGAAWVGCGSDATEDNVGPGGTLPDGSGLSPEPSAGAGEAPPPPPRPREFSLSTPSLSGFALVDAFPGAQLSLPSAIAWPKGGRPLVLQRHGTVEQITSGGSRRVLDFSSRVHLASEGGALGMALHPNFGDGSGASPYAYFWYNAAGMRQRLSRFTWNPASQSFDGGSELVLVDQAEEKGEHNAGRVAFGPDGFLYFGNGDDDDLSGGNDQRLDRDLVAGVFRIDVDFRGGSVSHPPPRQPESGRTAGYYIPNDNPFVGVPNALEEYWALGLRNPFSFAFDKQSGALWLGDVGDSFREEIDVVVKGGNYGWPYREGDIKGDLLRGTTPPTIGTLEGPWYTYSHASMANLSAILGGTVYRGKELPELNGKYIHSDWPSCRIWAVDTAVRGSRTTVLDNQSDCTPLGVAEDNDGELYLMRIGGVAKLVHEAVKDDTPRRLVDTTLFDDVAGVVPKAKLVPYEITSPLWSDGAVKRRFIYVPEGKHVTSADDGSLTFPVGTIFLKHFELPPSVAPRGRTRRLETRVLVVGEGAVYGLGYRWNAAGTDANLVLDETDEIIHDDATGQDRTWHYPSPGQCWSCHQSGRYRVLGFTAAQLARKTDAGAAQIEALAARGIFDPKALPRVGPAVVSPSDTSASLEARATSYLAANCSPCHHEGASYLGGGQTWRAEPGVPLSERGIVGVYFHNLPMARALGMTAWPLVTAGNPDGSILLARIKSNDPDLRMPPIARNVVDTEGARLIEEWIRSMR
jgi:uncharacterized repeat protein (TIGR03806 family)